MSNVVALPTKPYVEDLWGRYTALCRALRENPALGSDMIFMAKLRAAEAQYQTSFTKWARCA